MTILDMAIITVFAAGLVLGWSIRLCTFSSAALYWRVRCRKAERKLAGAVLRDPKTGRLMSKNS